MNALITMTDRLVLASGDRAARIWSSQAALLGLVLLAGFMAAVAAVGYFVPETNWDIFAYLASAHEAPGMTAREIHHFAYDTVQHAIPKGEFLVLTEDRDYRIRQYMDPDAFVTMLGFYRVKWLYIETISWLSNFTDPLNAVRLISSLSVAAIGIVAIVWMWTYRALHLAPLAIATMVLSGVPLIARLGTPDAFSTVFFLAGIFAFLRKREMATAIFLFLAFLARPDHAAYIGVLWVVSLFMRSFSWGTVAAFAAALVAYVPITHAAGHPGWWVQMWFTNVEYVGTLEGFDPAFSIVTYLKIVVTVITRSFVENQWPAVMIIGCAVWWQLARNHVDMGRREAIVLVATVLAIAAKFVVFPLFETRFFVAYLLAFCFVLLCGLAKVRFDLSESTPPAR